MLFVLRWTKRHQIPRGNSADLIPLNDVANKLTLASRSGSVDKFGRSNLRRCLHLDFWATTNLVVVTATNGPKNHVEGHP